MTGRDDDVPDACECCPHANGEPYAYGETEFSAEDLEFLTDERGEMDRRDVAKALATIGGLTAVGSLAAPLAGLSPIVAGAITYLSIDRYDGPLYGTHPEITPDGGEQPVESDGDQSDGSENGRSDGDRSDRADTERASGDRPDGADSEVADDRSEGESDE